MGKSTVPTGETGTPSETPTGGDKPLQTVGEAAGDALKFIESLIEEPITTASPEGNDKPEAETTPDETPKEEAGEQSETKETEQIQPDAGDDGLPPELQERIDKRIGKEVAKTKTERERAEAAEAKAAELEAKLRDREENPPAGATPRPVPLAELRTPEQCATHMEQAESALDWAEQQLVRMDDDAEGVLADLAGMKVDLGPEPSAGSAKRFLLQIKQNAARTIRRDVPQRLAYLNAERAAAEEAEKQFPWWKDRTSPEYAEAQEILRQFPEVRSRPHWKYILGTCVEGVKVMRARQAKPAGNGSKPKAVPKPQPGIPAGAAPEKLPAKEAHLQRARERFAKDPTNRDAQLALIEASLD